MEISLEEKHQRLRDVGMITGDELPEEFVSVVDSLTPEEVETLVSVKKRLDLAQDASGAPIGQNFVAP